MKHPHNSNRTAHQEVLKLLPWYVNQSLSGREKHLVEDHLKTCLMCRIELTNQHKLSASVQKSDPFTSVSHASFMQLQKRIHKVTDDRTDKKIGITGILAYFYHCAKHSGINTLLNRHPMVAFGVALLFSFALLIPGEIDFNQTQQYVEFHTLSDTKKLSAKENDIRVVFADEASPLQIKQILAKIEGRIVSGPTAQGVYFIRIEKQGVVAQDIIDIIFLLRKNVRIVFAEPAYTFLSPNNRKPG